MKEETNKHLDYLTKKLITKGGVESPSFNFTDAVMSIVENLSKNEITVYKSLISKRTWILILIGFSAIILYTLFFGSQTESTGWMSKIDMSVLSNNSISNTLSSLRIPKTFMYAMVFFGLMIFIQIPLLKNYLNKRFEN